MHAIQSFLIVVLCGFVWLTIILGMALAEEMTIYDKDWRVQERVQDGTIYDRDWRVKGYIEDGRVYDKNCVNSGDTIFNSWILKFFVAAFVRGGENGAGAGGEQRGRLFGD